MVEILELGSTAKDKHTGFEGVVMARTEYLYGCRRYGLMPEKLGEEGDVRDWVWFDAGRLIESTPSKPGGPRPDAPSG